MAGRRRDSSRTALRPDPDHALREPGPGLGGDVTNFMRAIEKRFVARPRRDCMQAWRDNTRPRMLATAARRDALDHQQQY